jgi:hypothetical protein
VALSAASVQGQQASSQAGTARIASAAAVPSGETALGTVTFPKAVKADGKSLPAGTYQVRLTAQSPSQPATGETPGLERWVEFLQKGEVKGREVATIVPQDDIKEVAKDNKMPAPNSAKVETLKGGDYLRLWINRGGNHYFVHFPAA